MDMDWNACRRYLQSISRRGIRPGLGRMRALMDSLGSPEKRFSAIHVAGTNGKGSVCAMLESVLRTSGRRTGLYTSPHLLDVTERIRVAGRDVSHSAFARLIGEIVRRSGRLEPRLTYFEMVTAAGFLYFAQQRVEIAVVETGLGGRLDATNVLPRPEAAIVTNIGLDHQDYLGETIDKIAVEKAGIFKTGSPALTGAQGPALKTIKRICDDRSMILIQASNRPVIGGVKVGTAAKGCSLKGRFQEKNIRVVLEAVRVLRLKGWKIPAGKILQGLKTVRWPGRFEWGTVRSGQRRVPLLLDGAHNPHAVQELVEAVREKGFARKNCVLVFNALKDKNVGGMLDLLLKKLRIVDIRVPRLPTGRTSQPKSVLQSAGLIRKGLRGAVFPSVKLLWSPMKIPEGTSWVLATGSLYLVGETLSILKREDRA